MNTRLKRLRHYKKGTGMATDYSNLNSSILFSFFTIQKRFIELLPFFHFFD